MISKSYFFVQKLTFAGVGIDPMAKTPNLIVKHPGILYGLTICSVFHFIIVSHYAYIHVTDFEEITDSFPMLCQLILCICKVMIFLRKRQQIFSLIREVHERNFKAEGEELAIVRRENAKDNYLCSVYLRIVIFSGSFAVLHPLANAVYVYIINGELVLTEPNKATYFWNYSNLAGYSGVYVLNVFTVYFVCVVSLAIDTLFSWFVSNVMAQFHIIYYRFERAALTSPETNMTHLQQNNYIISCIKYHHDILKFSEKLKRVYSEIIFIKFTIVCMEICSLVFRVSRPNDSLPDTAYKCLFLCAVAIQLMVYCYNGQRIKDESGHVSTAIYCIFDWSNLSKSCKKLLLISMTRSQKHCNINGVFFEVDFSLYLWVFKTAASLLTALKTLEEKQT
ncbi:odorant receptor 45a-like [Calliphora vicina]|uniref:odorant receptor 45a-like n=1 Tax=Calliphora vicina TaxID=7373 RepID=UPI00325B7031